MRTTPSTIAPTRGARRAAVLSILLLAAAAGRASAVPPPLLWVAHYDGGGTPFASDVLADLAVNAQGEVCATGASTIPGGAFAAATVFYESDGSERWRRLYTAPESAGNEQGLRVHLDDTGRCRVAGERSVQTPPGHGPDVLVLDYDPAAPWSSTPPATPTSRPTTSSPTAASSSSPTAWMPPPAP